MSELEIAKREEARYSRSLGATVTLSNGAEVVVSVYANTSDPADWPQPATQLPSWRMFTRAEFARVVRAIDELFTAYEKQWGSERAPG
jgi:hypothetical protein